MKKRIISLLLVLAMFVSFIPAMPVSAAETDMTMQEIVEAAYALAPGASLEGTHTLTGVITRVITPYNSSYKNVTVIITVEGCEDKPIMCYRLKGEGCEKLAVGDTITVTGVLKNYKGTIEFDAGCTLGDALASAAY